MDLKRRKPEKALSQLDGINIQLHAEVQGKNSHRGELLLTANEVQAINELVRQYTQYSFETKCATVYAEEDFQLQTMNNTLQQDKLSLKSVHYDSKKRKTNQISSDMGTNKRRQKASSVNTSSDMKRKFDEHGGIVKNLNKTKTTLPTNVQSNAVTAPVRMLRRRREVYTGDWIEACLLVTALLENEPSAKWFLTPVNLESAPNYLEKISRPMDLQTVKEKLQHGMYNHPFRWQEDIRTIFYNAYTYHTQKNQIRNDAVSLATHFEELCKSHIGVNPYGVSSNAIKARRSTANAEMLQRDEENTKYPRSNRHSRHDETDSNQIVLGASELRELLARAATVASAQRETLLTQSNTIDRDSSISDSQSRTHQAAVPALTTKSPILEINLPPPGLPPPPNPPLGTVRIGERGPNTVHRRLVTTQFKQLDVHLRHAALQLLKDELGVNIVEAACNPQFTIDFELLPYLKQKQIITYLRILDTFQRKMVEEGHRVTLASSLKPNAKGQACMIKPRENDELGSNTIKTNVSAPEIHGSGKSKSKSAISAQAKDSTEQAQPFSRSFSASSSSLSSSISSASLSDSSSHNLDSSNFEFATDDIGDFILTDQAYAASLDPTSPTVASSTTTTSLQSHSPTDSFNVDRPEYDTPFSKPNPSDSSLHIEFGSQNKFQSESLLDDLPRPQHGETPSDYANMSCAPLAQPNQSFNGSDLDEEKDESVSSQSDVAMRTEYPSYNNNLPSSWGEWKQKVIQYKIQCQMGDERNRNLLSTANLEQERDAESADAEI